MSRDWTPREHLAASRRMVALGYDGILDSMRNTFFVHKDGTQTPLYSEEEIALREQFPYFGSLYEYFPELYDALSKYENRSEFLEQKETELAEFIATGKGDPESYLLRWFNGELDKNFYYSERNDALLMERACEEAATLSLKQYGLYSAYKQEWYKDHGVSQDDIKKMFNEYLEDVKHERFEGSFQSYELEFGYHGGQIYACFNEFLDCEYQEMINDVDSLIFSADEASRFFADEASVKADNDFMEKLYGLDKE